MTITLCKEDDEHILTIYPGENAIDILTKILGTMHNCSFTVNGKTISTINDLSK